MTKSKKKQVPSKKATLDKKNLAAKYHTWRICPPEQHWVREHQLRVPRSEKNPDGLTSRQGHCAKNPSNLDQLYRDEMQEMAIRHFQNLSYMPKSDDLGFENGNTYDDLIAGWIQYWNETIKPSEPLDSAIVKALIATESGFNPKAKNRASKNNYARGLMQVTDESRKILADEKGELGNQLVNLTDADAYDPNLNIAAGTRWLFQKHKLASIKLKREATWEEAIENYKGYLDKKLKGQRYNKEPMEKLRTYYRRLKI